MQLRSGGGYISRSLSMQGVEFEKTDAPMSAVDTDLYNDCSGVWSDLFSIPGLWSNLRSSAVYHGASLRFFKGLGMTIRLPVVLNEAVAALEQGQQVILTSLTTEEAAITRSLKSEDGEDGDETAFDAADGQEETARLKNGTLLDCILQVIAYAAGNATSDAQRTSLEAVSASARALPLPAVGAIDIAKHRLAAALGNGQSCNEPDAVHFHVSTTSIRALPSMQWTRTAFADLDHVGGDGVLRCW